MFLGLQQCTASLAAEVLVRDVAESATSGPRSQLCSTVLQYSRDLRWARHASTAHSEHAQNGPTVFWSIFCTGYRSTLRSRSAHASHAQAQADHVHRSVELSLHSRRPDRCLLTVTSPLCAAAAFAKLLRVRLPICCWQPSISF